MRLGGWQWGVVVARVSLLSTAALALTCSGREPLPAPPRPAQEIEAKPAAITVPSGFVDEVFATGFNDPTQMQFAPDGRLFVAEQGGRLRVVKSGSTLATPFVSLSVDGNGERGLLGIAFDPNFASNNFVYVYYTTASGGTHNRLSRLTASGDVAAAGSEVVLVDFDRLSSATNHNGGAVQVGGDGKLYVAVGDNANGDNAQSLGNRHGKLHRYNLDGSIPSDNPFFSRATGVNRSIWALGLRNPFTFAVEPGTGKIFINDVGQDAYEEINVGAAGANYGWPRAEGPEDNGPADTAPLYAYGHGTGCSIAGGTFYRPANPQFPAAWLGHYFFADYCEGWIRRLDPATKQVAGFASGISEAVDLKTGADGALYYLDRGNGRVGRIRASTGAPPRIDVQPAGQTVALGQRATFSVAASGTAPLAYQWQRNGVSISGATAPSYTTPAVTSADNAAGFRVIVSNGFGSVTSNSATLAVSANRPPVGTITAPAAGTTYAAGDTIAFAGSATDAEDGALAPGAFTWHVDFHHDTHTHPFMAPTPGSRTGSFVIPNRGETASNVWYRIYLTVTDRSGATHTSFVEVRPRTSKLTLATVPAGLALMLDGQPVAAGTVVTSVAGIVRSLGAPSPQNANGKSYELSSWSDGGAASHEIATPTTDTTYTATFRELPPSGVPTGGLLAEYFDNLDFSGTRITRTDPTVDFDWARGAPDPRLGSDTFSARWTGKVTPVFSESYTFYTVADDGVRLWVNGQLVIDAWYDQGANEHSGSINLTAGQSYDLKLEYYENGGFASAQLLWSSARTAKAIVPTARLGGGGDPPPPPPPPGFPIKINFQLAGVAVPTGYLPDTGALFGPRNGASYGWNKDHTDLTRDRDLHVDQRLDTLCHFHAGGVWEIALPNGSYNVLASIGDPQHESTHTLHVEGQAYWSNRPLTPGQFLSATKSITITDGRLTVDQGPAAEKATRINYLEISR